MVVTKSETHTHAAPERLCINLLHLNIQVSVLMPIVVMQHVRRISKNILFSEFPPYHPFPLQSNLPEREKKNCLLQPQPRETYSNPH